MHIHIVHIVNYWMERDLYLASTVVDADKTTKLEHDRTVRGLP